MAFRQAQPFYVAAAWSVLSAKLTKLLFRDSQLLKNLVVQPATDLRPGMYRYGRGASVSVLPASMTAFLAGAHKTEPLGSPHQFLRLSRHAQR